MIVRVQGHVYRIERSKVTHERYQGLIALSGLEDKLKEVELSILTESAKGPGLELRRARERARRLRGRIEALRGALAVK